MDTRFKLQEGEVNVASPVYQTRKLNFDITEFNYNKNHDVLLYKEKVKFSEIAGNINIQGKYHTKMFTFRDWSYNRMEYRCLSINTRVFFYGNL